MSQKPKTSTAMAQRGHLLFKKNFRRDSKSGQVCLLRWEEAPANIQPIVERMLECGKRIDKPPVVVNGRTYPFKLYNCGVITCAGCGYKSQRLEGQKTRKALLVDQADPRFLSYITIDGPTFPLACERSIQLNDVIANFSKRYFPNPLFRQSEIILRKALHKGIGQLMFELGPMAIRGQVEIKEDAHDGGMLHWHLWCRHDGIDREILWERLKKILKPSFPKHKAIHVESIREDEEGLDGNTVNGAAYAAKMIKKKDENLTLFCHVMLISIYTDMTSRGRQGLRFSKGLKLVAKMAPFVVNRSSNPNATMWREDLLRSWPLEAPRA